MGMQSGYPRVSFAVPEAFRVEAVSFTVVESKRTSLVK
jgi:hypothetical protein